MQGRWLNHCHPNMLLPCHCDSLILPDDLNFFARCHLWIENFTVCIIIVESIYKCFAQNFGGKIISKVKIMKKYKYIDEISSSGLERREKKIVGIYFVDFRAFIFGRISYSRYRCTDLLKLPWKAVWMATEAKSSSRSVSS